MEGVFGRNGNEGHIEDGDLQSLSLFLGVLKHVGVLGNSCGINIIGDHFGGDINNVESMEASAMQLEGVHESLGFEYDVYGLGGMEFSDPCLLHSIDDEVTATTFGGFVQIVIIPHLFVDGLGAVADIVSSVVVG